MTLTEIFSNVEIDLTKLVVAELKKTRESFVEDLGTITLTGEAIGYASWDDPEEDKKEIYCEMAALDRVLKLFGE